MTTITPEERGRLMREIRQALCLHDNAVGDITMVAIRDGQSACYESPEYRNWRTAQRQVISLVPVLLDALDAAEERAVMNIRQHVPVIVQRDEAERKLALVEGELGEAREAREALEDMCHQFAYDGKNADGPTLYTGGLSALEGAFDALGWDDPYPIPDSKCDDPGCTARVTCGTPTDSGYRRTCSEHAPGRERGHE